LWQVADSLEDENTLQRELASFEEAKQFFPDAEHFLVTKTIPKKLPKGNFKLILYGRY